VVPRGQFGDDAAKFGMDADLAEDPVGDEAPGGIEYRDRGLVTTGLDA
jgi:hypothetical protein